MKLTDWFPVGTHPKRAGMYQVRIPGTHEKLMYWRYWNGKCWLVLGVMTYRPMPSLWTARNTGRCEMRLNVEWRGVEEYA